MLRSRLKRTLFLVFLAASLAAAIIIRRQYVVPVLMYHRIDERAAESKLSVSPDSFARQMAFLKKHKTVIPLSELAGAFSGGGRLPRDAVVITFDDGYENNYTAAWPILRELNLPATVFVVTDWVGRNGYLTWEEIEEMAEGGITIGSHTRSHPFLTSLDDEELIGEVAGSRNLIEEKLGRKVRFLAYPVGNFDERVISAVKDSGYLGACATNPGPDWPDDDVYALKRVRISRTSDNLPVFFIESSGYYTWIKEMRDED